MEENSKANEETSELDLPTKTSLQTDAPDSNPSNPADEQSAEAPGESVANESPEDVHDQPEELEQIATVEEAENVQPEEYTAVIPMPQPVPEDDTDLAVDIDAEYADRVIAHELRPPTGKSSRHRPLTAESYEVHIDLMPNTEYDDDDPDAD
jgi:hypothetical protein